MFDHLGIVVADLRRARAFYEPLLMTLNVKLWENNARHDGTGWLVFSSGAPQSGFFVVAAGRPTFWSDAHEAGRSPVHIAFTAPSKEAVDLFHATGLRLGARDNGAPGVRRPPYHCAFLIDPDDNNIEAGVYLSQS